MTSQGKKQKTHWTKNLTSKDKTALVRRPNGVRKYYPTKFTKETRETILHHVGLCATYETACAIAGISSEALRIWRKQGEENPMSEFGKFNMELEQARARAVQALVARVVNASTMHWKAAAFLLTHLSPEQYGNRVKVEQTVTVQNALDHRTEEDLEYYVTHKRWPEEREP
jgi:hypothetical protein